MFYQNNLYMKKNYVIALAALLSVCSCSEESLGSIDLQDSERTKTPLTKDVNNHDVFCFNSTKEFELALDSLANLNSSTEKTKWVKEHLGSQITTMHDIYVNAQDDAIALDESEESFNSFKRKYANLFFPLYMEDAGFYMPFKNQDIGYLANKDGFVFINGQLVDKKDIFNYADLQEAGLAYYSKEKKVEGTRSTNESPFYVYADATLEDSYDSDWHEENGKKIRLKLNRRIASYRTELHAEVSFRKHTWLGWTNYSSHTTTTLSLKFYDDEGINQIGQFSDTQEHSGDSSHDSYVPIPVVTVNNSSTTYYYKLYRMKVNCTVEYRGMPTLQYYEHELMSLRSVNYDSTTPRVLYGL